VYVLPLFFSLSPPPNRLQQHHSAQPFQFRHRFGLQALQFHHLRLHGVRVFSDVAWLQPVPNGPQELESSRTDTFEQFGIASRIAKTMLVQKSLIGTFTESRAGTSEICLAEWLQQLPRLYSQDND